MVLWLSLCDFLNRLSLLKKNYSGIVNVQPGMMRRTYIEHVANCWIKLVVSRGIHFTFCRFLRRIDKFGSLTLELFGLLQSTKCLSLLKKNYFGISCSKLFLLFHAVLPSSTLCPNYCVWWSSAHHGHAENRVILGLISVLLSTVLAWVLLTAPDEFEYDFKYTCAVVDA